MVSTFHSLELGKNSLLVNQKNIATTGHNIANANTKGYSRQQVNTNASIAVDIQTSGQVNPSQLGSGVSVESITRVRDQFLDIQYRNQSSSLGEWSVKQETLAQLEIAINEPSDTGLAASMDQLWEAWDDLANNPDSIPVRAVVIERAQGFIDTAQAIEQSMSSIKSSLDEKQTAKLAEANGLLDQIAELNASIKRTGKQANDLLDQRDLLVEQLSQMVSINVKEQTDGGYNISLTDGTSLVKGSIVENKLDETSDVLGGELAGINQSKQIVADYQTKLSDLVKGLVFGEMKVVIPAGSNLSDGTVVNQPRELTVDGLNGLSQLGWSLSEDASGIVQPGAALFAGGPEEFSISTLSINAQVKENVGLLAASLRSETVNGKQKVVIGNNDLAQLIANLRNEKVTIGGSLQNIGSFFQSMVSELGTESKVAMNHVANQEAVLLATDHRRQSITGVSLDEEMANLIKFQHAYNAAAKFVSATDEMLDTIINRLGR